MQQNNSISLQSKDNLKEAKMANTNTSKVANVFSKMWNPLRTLTKPEIERMITNAQHGDDVRMQLVFSQIEQLSPIYQVCI